MYYLISEVPQYICVMYVPVILHAALSPALHRLFRKAKAVCTTEYICYYSFRNIFSFTCDEGWTVGITHYIVLRRLACGCSCRCVYVP